MSPDFSIIIPAYNEAENFRRGTLDTVLSYLNTQNFTWELILINDGSKDTTAKLLADFAKKDKRIIFIDNPHMGKAATIMSAAKHASGKHVLFSDMDQATPITEMPKLLQGFADGADIVIGSRADRKGAPLFRQVLAYGNIIMRTIVLRLPFKDTQCGFKAFSSDAASKIFAIMESVHPIKVITGPAVNAGFDMEILYLARKLGYKVIETPVSWHHQKTERVSFFRDAIASIEELLLIRYRAIKNAYNLK